MVSKLQSTNSLSILKPALIGIHRTNRGGTGVAAKACVCVRAVFGARLSRDNDEGRSHVRSFAQAHASGPCDMMASNLLSFYCLLLQEGLRFG